MGVAQRPKALDRSVLGAGAVIAVFLILHHSGPISPPPARTI